MGDTKKTINIPAKGTSPAFQWLRLGACTARDLDPLLGQGTKLLHAKGYSQIYVYTSYIKSVYIYTHLLRTSSPVREMGVQNSAKQQLVSPTSYTLFFFFLGLLHLLNFFPSQQQRHGPHLFPISRPPVCGPMHPAVQSSVCATWLSECSEYGVLISEGFLHLLVNSAHFSNEPQAAGGSTGVTP